MKILFPIHYFALNWKMDGTDNRRLSNLDNLIWGKACDPEVFYYIYVRDFYFYYIQEIAVNCIAAHVFQSERHPLSSPEKNKRVYFCAPAVHHHLFFPHAHRQSSAGRADDLPCGESDSARLRPNLHRVNPFRKPSNETDCCLKRESRPAEVVRLLLVTFT